MSKRTDSCIERW